MYSGAFPVSVSVTLEEVVNALKGVSFAIGDTVHFRADVLNTSGGLISEGAIRSFTLQNYVSQTITFATPPPQLITTPSSVVTPSASSSRIPVVSSDTPSVCTAASEGGSWRVTHVSAGDCVLSAREDGGVADDVSYAPADPVTVAFVISRQSRTMTIDPASFSSSYAHWASSPPTLVGNPSAGAADGTQSFEILGTNPPCSVNRASGVVTLIKPGTCVAQAVVSQGALYTQATSSTVSFTIGKRPQNVSGLPASAPQSAPSALLELTSDVNESNSSQVTGMGSPVFSTATAGCTISGSALTWTKDSFPESCLIAVSRGGNDYWEDGAGSFSVTLTSKKARTITVGPESRLDLSDIGTWGGAENFVASIVDSDNVSESAKEDGEKEVFETAPGSSGCQVNSDTGEVTFTGAGTCKVRARIPEGSTWAAAVSAEKVMAVGKRTLTAEAPTLSVMYGENLGAPLSPVLSGFAGSHPESTLTKRPSCTTTYAVGAPVGATPSVVCQGGEDDNYDFTYSPGSITVTQRPISLVVASASRLLNTPNPSFAITIGGTLAGGDTLATAAGAPVASVSLPAEGPGAFPVTLSNLTGSPNYDITEVPGLLYIASLEIGVQVADEPDENDIPILTSDLVECECAGLKPGSEATLTIYSTPTVLQTVTVADDGTCPLLKGSVPADIEPGTHTLEVSGVFPNGDLARVEVPIVVPEQYAPPIVVVTQSPTEESPRRAPGLFAFLIEAAQTGAVRAVPAPPVTAIPELPGPATTDETLPACVAPGTITAESTAQRTVVDRREVSLEQLSTENLSGLRLDCSITVTVVGSRTTSRMVLTSLQALDALWAPGIVTRSGRHHERDFASAALAPPSIAESPVLRSQELFESVMARTLGDSRLGQGAVMDPRLVAREQSWVSMSVTGSTYVPGSIVFAVVTSDPLVLAQALVPSSGEVTLEVNVPLSTLASGEHRVRLVGERSWPDMVIIEGGRPVVTPETLAEIAHFDADTVATLVLHGTGHDGNAHQIVRAVALEAPPAWWTLWILLGAVLSGYALRFIPLRRSPARRLASVALAAGGALPGIIIGWLSTVTIVAWWALGLGLAATLIAAIGPYRVPSERVSRG